MLSTLYIQLPARASQTAANSLQQAPMQFALFNEQQRLMQQGLRSLAELRQLAASAKRLVLLLAASDSRIVPVQVPKMAASKLKLALPNLLEQQVLSDTSELAIHALSEHQGVWQVAAIDKNWLQQLADFFKDWPNRQILAFPRQLLAAEHTNDKQSLIWLQIHQQRAELQVRQADQPAWGLQLEYSDWSDLLQQVAQLFPKDRPEIYLEAKALESLRADTQAQELIRKNAADWRFHETAWLTAVPEKQLTAVDLFQALGKAIKPGMDLKRWRWPLILLGASVVLHLLALNLEWWLQKREMKNIEAAMQQAFRQALPKEPVIRDPILQAQQKVNTIKRQTGQFAANDFIPMAAQFAEVWDSLMPGRYGSVLALEYKERQLIVKVRPGDMPPLNNLQAALQSRGLQVQSNADGVLQISVGGQR